jgi:aminomethyltransferase
MKTTRFNEIHRAYGAKMVDFVGFDMPVQYKKGIIHETKHVREKVGVFDVSHMGEFEVRGKDALKYLQKISVNDASKLTYGKVQYSAMCYTDGGIVDDMLVYNLGEDFYMLVVNGSNIEKDWDWCMMNTEGFDVELKNASDDVNLLAVQGPKSRETLQPLTDTDMSEGSMPFYTFKEGKLAGVEMIISRTGYTGELGYELYFRGDKDVAKNVWNAIFDEGEKFDIEPVGLGSRDTLRLEKGYCLYGNDIDETTNTIEAGLGWITKVKKDGDFNGKDVILKVKEEKPKRRLVPFIVQSDKFIPRKGYKILKNGEEIGHVTSGNLSPTLNKPIGMGYVKSEFKDEHTEIELEARGRKAPAIITKLPFVQ